MHKPSARSALRALKNVFQVIAIAALMLALAYLAAVFALNIFLNSGRGKKIMNNASRGYGLHEFFARRIHLNLYGTLTVEDFALSKTFGFTSGTALKASKISAHVKPEIFWGRQARISSIIAEGLQLTLPGPALAEIKNMRLAATNVSTEKPFDVQVDAALESHGRQVSVKAVVSVDKPSQRLIVQHGALDNTLVFSGQVDLSGKIPRYDFIFKGDRATWEKLVALLADNDTFRTIPQDPVYVHITGVAGSLTVENKSPK
jgi:hypothetical protein